MDGNAGDVPFLHHHPVAIGYTHLADQPRSCGSRAAHPTGGIFHKSVKGKNDRRPFSSRSARPGMEAAFSPAFLLCHGLVSGGWVISRRVFLVASFGVALFIIEALLAGLCCIPQLWDVARKNKINTESFLNLLEVTWEV